MQKVLLVLLFLVSSQSVLADSKARVLCHDRFEDEIWEMTGEHFDDKGCKAMMIAGNVGMCFEGPAEEIVTLMNAGTFVYFDWQKINAGSAKATSEDVITYQSYEGDFAAWTRDDVTLFRCPKFDKIKEYTTKIARELDSSSDMAVSRRYLEEFGLPFWLEQ